MSRASKVKVEVAEVRELVDLIQVLKDVADMKYHALAAQKVKFNRFNESFTEFFSLMGYSQVAHPLVANSNPNAVILVVSTERGFVGDLNSRVVARAMEEKEKNPQSQFVVAGKKGIMKLEGLGQKLLKTWEDIEDRGFYEVAVDIKTYLVKEVLEERIGRVIIVYPWPKDYTVIKPRAVKLLPCEDLLPKQTQTVEKFRQVIEESDAVDMIGYLADLWLSAKIYEIFFDTNLAAASAQTQQLDSSLTKMRKEREVVKLKYRKARRGDIDKSLREVFSARMMVTK
ncbi:MAG: F0F1 ATP synthase subunit gamma [Candidatus Omnitrophica bacterium]|nr:F0F1 ATP synthase subunit gamma [Candidatus Omnitrophota bacterium]MDE2009316.1 F0F1 ATP synthase subunit gamma [Candidatus Omnitrophota bacterium]MDE2214100.1 F0F1 ATP synthase subunit gamma [Candidatus Omnitrophota bacterium]MDE2231137.1 F0F1 ATP synthase subunit gamma [Candidatus Omnitrophota bacterium]